MKSIRLFLCAALLGLFSVSSIQFSYAAEAKAEARAAMKNVSVDEAEALLSKKDGLVVLDVRTAKEFSGGHLPDAKNLDFYDKEFATHLSGLDKAKTYVVFCAVGGRSAKACGQMTQLGFTNVINVEGGMKAWEKAGKPTVK